MTNNLRGTIDSAPKTSHQALRLIIGWGLPTVLLPITLTAALAQEAKPASKPAAAPTGNPGRGKALYAKVGCAACHGALGEGGSALRIVPLSTKLPEFTSFLRKPSPSMSPLSKSDASDAQLADMYAFLLSVSPKAETVAATPPAGNAENGKRLYNTTGCWECHGYVGQGGAAGPKVGPQPISFPAFVAALRRPRDMPPYTGEVLSDALVADIYAYVQTFPAPPNVDSLPLLKH